MKLKTICTTILLLFALSFTHAQIDCTQDYELTLDENGEGEILVSELVPNIEFLLSTGTVLYFVEPFSEYGVVNSGSDIINLPCNSASKGTYFIEHYVQGVSVDFCIENFDILDPTNSCPDHPLCNDPDLHCLRSYQAVVSGLNDEVSISQFLACDHILTCPGEYGIAAGTLDDVQNLAFEPFLDI